VTALTKRLCEDLAAYLDKKGLRVRYLHSEIETLERLQILTGLRTGEFDVLVGVNLLREGLDLPEVNLVCILDADKQGFLRSPTSLIQQMGRAARNAESTVVMYADVMTPAMKEAIEETERRRAKQIAYNLANGITPQTIRKAIRQGMDMELKARRTARDAVQTSEQSFEVEELIAQLQQEMLDAANALEFEKAGALRDQIAKLKKLKAESDQSGESSKVKRSQVERGQPAKPKAGMPGVRANKKSKRRPKSSDQ
jgi:excinuclease ABC subunit B